MSISQYAHGKRYEDSIKASFIGASDCRRVNTSKWDIESKFDKIRNIPTIIKTTKSDTVCMADATRFWGIDLFPYRLLIGTYNQNGDIKDFSKMYEFIISEEEHNKIIGNLSLEEVSQFHNDICSFKYGQHEKAREFAKNKKIDLQYKTLVQLNPKIDSDSQRRLQCSLSIKLLTKECKELTEFNENNRFFNEVNVVFPIKSSPREFNVSKKKRREIDKLRKDKEACQNKLDLLG